MDKLRMETPDLTSENIDRIAAKRQAQARDQF